MKTFAIVLIDREIYIPVGDISCKYPVQFKITLETNNGDNFDVFKFEKWAKDALCSFPISGKTLEEIPDVFWNIIRHEYPNRSGEITAMVSGMIGVKSSYVEEVEEKHSRGDFNSQFNKLYDEVLKNFDQVIVKPNTNSGYSATGHNPNLGKYL